jgi:UDP-GlcNAc:undecaprenyl-phosphate GlcNAc-1-phosphate transferase
VSTWEIILAAVLAAALSGACIPAAIGLGHRFGLLDMPGRHKRHSRPTPPLGGPALFVAFWGTMLILVLAFPDFKESFHGSLGYILAGSLIMLLVGVSDDLSPLTAWPKLLAQIGAGLVLYIGGLTIDPLTIPFYGPVATGGYSVIITVVWVVMLTNAINLLDGLDGLAAGVSLIATVVLVTVGWIYDVTTVVLLGAALAGFLLVFLGFNRYPAKIFLGDGGSLQIGFYFAVFSLLVPIRSYTAAALYVPLLALGLPIFEAGLSFSRRLISGKPVMQGDRRHLFHVLSLAGLSHRQVIFVFYALSVVFGLCALAMIRLNRFWVMGFLSLFMVVILALFLILLTNLPRLVRRDNKAGNGRNTLPPNGDR